MHVKEHNQESLSVDRGEERERQSPTSANLVTVGPYVDVRDDCIPNKGVGQHVTGTMDGVGLLHAPRMAYITSSKPSEMSNNAN